MSESPVPGAASQSPVNLPETKSTAEPGIVLVRKLASTSGSRLWLAKRGETQVVIKVPKPVKGDEKQTRKHVEHVINEYNVLRSLQKLKPDLAVVFPLREVDQTLIRTNGVELPYMEAGDLFEMAVALPRMDEAEVRVIFAPVAGTLAWMHANRFVHRDIKPENILMDKSGRVCLADFAFAKQYSSTDSIESLGKGSEQYLAPELMLKSSYNPFAADVWSLAVTMINFATQIPAYPKCMDNHCKALIKDVAAGRLPPWNKGVSAPLTKLLVGMLHADPAQRLTMKQVLEHTWWAGDV